MEILKGAVPVYLQIEQDLRNKIKSGRYKVGDRFIEKDLVKEYGVSRLTLKKATSILVADGYLSQTPAKGTFVTSPDKQDTLQDNGLRFKKLNRGIGILVSCVTGSPNPGIIRGVEDVCEKNGYHLILGNYDAIPEKEKKYMETFVERGISGLVISASHNSYLNPYYKILKEKNIPFVFVDVKVDGIESDLVATDNFTGAYLGTKFLINKGCKDILFLCTSLRASSTRERLQGYRFALKESGVSFKKDLVRESENGGHYAESFGEKETEIFLNRGKIDGIFSANEPVIFGVLRAVKKKAVKKSRKIHIVSFDKPEIPMELAYPITFIVQPLYQIGHTGCELLFERIKEKRRGVKTPYKRVLLEPELIEAP